MLSGNGRHRRPRQAPALLVAAGVTGSAIAIPLLGAGAASAADGSTWDKVAECESGGAWSANSGNGFYGGLQLAQEDWEQYGGLDYAASADQASRSQQIAVAEKVLADQGAGAWPTCGLVYGLGEDSRSADVDTGLAGEASADESTSSDTSSGSSGLSDSPESSSSSESSSASGSPSPSSSPSSSPSDGSSDATDNSAKSDTSPESDASASQESGSPSTGSSQDDDSDKSGQNGGSSYLTDTGTGKHRGGSADEGTAGDRTDSSGRHASRGDDDARVAADDSYTVRAGDTLCSIADSLEVNGGWRELYAENKGAVGADPNLIIPGQTLEVGA
ncbi:transglycosylase family protein [Streptomyces sp. GESEQ-35]|uniref:LysM peptidoglycan-binding domain-containing protein n=1 Tax=Streptomyces sp. GESEQ-35 TaxID=2812657 RepID=UPI001B32CB08|nr:transglycosylase family protein [Streptomyces sp. GESEQ-35]